MSIVTLKILGHNVKQASVEQTGKTKLTQHGRNAVSLLVGILVAKHCSVESKSRLDGHFSGGRTAMLGFIDYSQGRVSQWPAHDNVELCCSPGMQLHRAVPSYTQHQQQGTPVPRAHWRRADQACILCLEGRRKQGPESGAQLAVDLSPRSTGNPTLQCPHGVP